MNKNKAGEKLGGDEREVGGVGRKAIAYSQSQTFYDLLLLTNGKQECNFIGL